MPAPRRLPSIDALMKAEPMAAPIRAFGRESVKHLLRQLQMRWRERGEAPEWTADPAAWAIEVQAMLGRQGYRRVFNLTGTVVHSNLGRAPLSHTLFDSVRDLVTGPMNLEYDLASGSRGDRDGPVERRLALLTGAEAATVVNNNAAAVMLVLNTLARERGVAVSRGELIEIGGSFRLPEIMERAGCRLLEVGTTNRTHPADYLMAMEDAAAMLLKVHPSNFHLSGFTRSVSISELAAIAREQAVPLCVDLGSGTLVDLTRWGLPHEPTPRDVLGDGADLVTFSGDKLLGGVQAGLIVGKQALVDACRRNPMKRALRPDKITLAYLDGLLALYEQPEQLADQVPLLRVLTLPQAELQQRATSLAPLLQQRLPGCAVEVVESEALIGSGSLPDQVLPSVAVRITPAGDASASALQTALRQLAVPVIGRLSRGAVWLDMRGAEPLDDLHSVLAGLVPPA